MSDLTTHLNIPKPNPDHLPPVHVNEEFLRLREAWDIVDLFLHELALLVAQKAASDHGHAMSAITGLIDALNSKMAANQQFKLDDLTDVSGADGAATNYVLVKASGGGWVPSTALAALGVHPHLISEVTGLAAALTDRPTRDEVEEALDLLSADIDKRVAVDGAQSFTASEKGRAIANIDGGSLSGFRNKLINGDGQVSQRTYATVADDVYWCDRHYVLTQTAAITPTILTDIANGLPFMMRLSQSQATAQRMGNAQIVEAVVSKRLRGKQVTLGGKLRCSASQAVRFAVLEWTGTADVVTSDVVASWTNAAFSAGNFFLGSNLTVAAVGTITPAANTLTDWSMTANISGSCNNIIVMMWTEGTAAQNVTLDMAWCLVRGDATAEAWPYEVRSTPQELLLCQWFGRLVGLCPDYTNGVSASAIYRTYTIPAMRVAPSGVVVTTPTGFTSGGGGATLTTFSVNFTKTTSFSVVAAAAVGISGWDNGASVFLNSEL